MPSDYKQVETLIQIAIQGLDGNRYQSISQAAKELSIPYERLRNRYHGRLAKSGLRSGNNLLSSEQEAAVIKYIDYFDDLHLPITRAMLRSCVNAILSRSHDDETSDPPTISEQWVKRFLRRHPELHIRRQKTIEIARKEAHDPDLVKDWYQRFEQVTKDYGIQPSDIYNTDETGFRIGVGRDQWVITRHSRRKVYIGSDTNRESLTVIEAVSTDGFVAPPMFIFNGKMHMESWFEYLQEEESIAISESGYSNDRIAYQWIQRFHEATRSRTRGTHRLLVLDGYDSHCTYEFLMFCQSVNIIPFFLIPHTSHLCQPLDVGVFQAYKYHHSQAVANASRTGCTKFSKTEFLNAIGDIRRATFKTGTIKTGWRESGLHPFCPAKVLDFLYQQCTPPVSREQSPEPGLLATPSKPADFERLAAAIRDTETTTPQYNTMVQKLSKGSVTQSHLMRQLSYDLYMSEMASAGRRKRERASRRRVNAGGVVVAVEQARRMVKAREATDEDTEKNKNRRKFKKVMEQLKRGIRNHELRKYR